MDNYTEYLSQQEGVNFTELRSLDRDSVGISSNWSLYKEFENIYRKVKPDLILHYTSKPIIFGGRAAHLNNIPSIAIVTGLGYAFINKGWIHKITKYLYKKAAPFHTRFLFENEDDLALFSKSIISKDQGKSIKGCGVDEVYFAPRPQSQMSNVTTFTFIGRLLVDKGIKEFVEAARYYKNSTKIQFRVIGQLDDQNPSKISEEQLQSWINDELISYISFKEDIRNEIASSDCVVLPSYREGLPRTILEAMSMAKPIIVSDTPGCRETIDNEENGFLIEVKNVQSLVDAISRFLQLSDKQKIDMGAKGREMVIEQFTARKIALEIYNETTNILA